MSTLDEQFGTGTFDPSAVGPGFSSKSRMEVGSYAAVMGACKGGGVNEPGTSFTPSSGDWWTDPTGQNRCFFMPGSTWAGAADPYYNCSFGGVVCSNGAMIWKKQRTLVQITDGTSNTLILAEQSGMMTYPVGGCTGSSSLPTAEYKYPANHCYNGGTSILIGDPAAQDPPSTTSPTNGTAPGSTTVVRWPVNTSVKKFNSDGLNGGQYNIGYNSAHPSGANALRCDGSVVFLSQSLDYNVLMYMSIIDDGQTVANP